MKLECTSMQLEAIRRACDLYGRLHMHQWEFLIEDLTDMSVGLATSGAFAKHVQSFVDKMFPAPWPARLTGCGYNNLGDIAFEVGRGIHAYKHKQDKGDKNKYMCCSCNRSTSNLSGEPVIKITKGRTK